MTTWLKGKKRVAEFFTHLFLTGLICWLCYIIFNIFDVKKTDANFLFGVGGHPIVRLQCLLVVFIVEIRGRWSIKRYE